MAITLRTNTAHGSVVSVPELGGILSANGLDPIITDDETLINFILIATGVGGSLDGLSSDNAYPASPDVSTNTIVLLDDAGDVIVDPVAFAGQEPFVPATAVDPGVQGLYHKPVQADRNRPITGGGAFVPIEEALKLDFDFTTVTPLNFETLSLGDIITRLQVITKQTFDDVASFVTVGTVLQGAGSIMAIGDVDLGNTGVYEDPQHYEITGADQLRLVLSPGASTQGQGRVLAIIRRV